MWILENDGDAFQGKKLWLRPGKKFLFGRTKVEGGQFAISDKTISRKHLTLEVEPVGSDDCKNPHKRSRVILEDIGTKIGTVVNDEQIRGSRYELKSEHNVIKLGHHKFLFHITWRPVTFTFSFTGKQVKADPFTKLYNILGPLDIKVLNNYERGKTTHVVAGKRNTSKGLQALINGKFIVNDAFWEAIVKVAELPSENTLDEESLSPLEEDFEAAFPNALEYLPPRGQEQTDRPSEAYAPNTTRQDMFEGYTYIFYEQSQFNNLLAPITEGRGKALLHQVIPSETTVNDFVRYVKNAANEKGDGEFEDGSAGKGVVVVKFSPAKGPTQPWYEEFCKDVSLHLDHRLIEQNEFLDAILNIDASVLRKPLAFEQSGIVPPPPSIATGVQTQTLRSSPPPPNPAPTQSESNVAPGRGRPRRAVKSRFKGFDSDDEDTPPVNDMPRLGEMTQLSAPVESQSQGMFVSQDPTPMDVDSQPAGTQTRSSRKRKTPPVEIEPEEDIMEQMAPAAAARKKRRQAAEAAVEEKEGPFITPVEEKRPSIPISKTKKVQKREEIDVQQELARRREKEKEIADAETQALREQLEGMDIEQIRNLSVIEEIEVARSAPPRRVHGEESDRWDDKWNGRKNFKKFRRRGEGGSRVVNRVIVPLEEVKKRDYGIGDEYWLEEDSQRIRRKEKDTQEVSQNEPRLQRRTRGRASEKVVEEKEVNHPPAMDASSDVEITQDQETANTSPTATTRKETSKTISKSSQNKRPAATTLTKPAPAKKPRQGLKKPESDDDDNDSEDELKFRFRRKR